MSAYPEVDTNLAELWEISSDMKRWVRAKTQRLRVNVALWEPQPCPPKETT